jgi:hypothetical protein
MALPKLQIARIEAAVARQEATIALVKHVEPWLRPEDSPMKLAEIVSTLVAAALTEGIILGKIHSIEGG